MGFTGLGVLAVRGISVNLGNIWYMAVPGGCTPPVGARTRHVAGTPTDPALPEPSVYHRSASTPSRFTGTDGHGGGTFTGPTDRTSQR